MEARRSPAEKKKELPSFECKSSRSFSFLDLDVLSEFKLCSEIQLGNNNLMKACQDIVKQAPPTLQTFWVN